MKTFLKDKRGYTLVELMVVITIMAILAAASTPVFSGYMKKAKASEYLAECRSIYMAAETYLIETQRAFDLDVEELEEELEDLTTLHVEVMDDTDEKMKGDFGVVISEDEEGQWKCEAVVCVIDGERWIFDTETGKFEEE